MTSPAGLRGPGDSPAGWSPRRPAGITQETGRIWGQLIGKDPDAGKDCRREEKGMIEDEMVGWHHRLNGHEFE